MFNKLTSEVGLLNKSSYLGAALGVTESIVLLKSDLNVQQTCLCLGQFCYTLLNVI